MQATPQKLTLRMASGTSAAPGTRRAAEQACDQCLESLEAPIDTAFIFFSAHHLESIDELSSTVLRRLSPKSLIGASTIAAIGGITEMENTPGVSILAACMPGVTAHTFTFEDLPTPPDDDAYAADPAGSIAPTSRAIGAAEDLRLTTVFVDRSSVPLTRTLPALNRARTNRAPIIGAQASASSSAGGNALLLNDRIFRSGGVGLSLRGNLHVDTVVSQGCRPFGPNLVVTKAKFNLIFELGGRNAVEVVQETVLTLGENYSAMLAGGLYIGRVIDEYKSRFGRNDFLIRNVIGVDPKNGAIAVEDRFRVGQTIRLHCRDAVTAHEDLALLLDAQKLYDRPKGALLITCNGRGRKMFAATDQPNDHDALAVGRAFSQFKSGEFLAKPGKPFEPPTLSPIPLAGLFAAGEIGPVGTESFLHGHTACLALFRD